MMSSAERPWDNEDTLALLGDLLSLLESENIDGARVRIKGALSLVEENA